ncbi:hypothetical protein HMPREF9103_00011 [Lentilactobacillus parafarraginis F0439]|uniref:Uncharacterized protein n=1 Tax=Lentilactobacillus parafarraginis F0439 TaxID=797515 RepID=G9ZJW5_9LACO|nr:hypothetical protein HMPREF9103_00011 [Lentilactobacillus parafarraginis F0439]
MNRLPFNSKPIRPISEMSCYLTYIVVNYSHSSGIVNHVSKPFSHGFPLVK